MSRKKAISTSARNLMGSGYRKIEFFNEIWSFGQNAIAIFVSGVAFLGTSTSGRKSGGIIDISSAPFAARFIGMVAIAAAIGWLLGLGVSRLTRDQSQGQNMIGYIFAIICGAFLVLTADWLSFGGRERAFPELQILCFFGLCTSLWVSTYQFQVRIATGATGVLASRAWALMFFGATSLVVLALSILE